MLLLINNTSSLLFDYPASNSFIPFLMLPRCLTLKVSSFPLVSKLIFRKESEACSKVKKKKNEAPDVLGLIKRVWGNPGMFLVHFGKKWLLISSY